jgi:hypothetical protein
MNDLIKIGDSFQNGRFIVDILNDAGNSLVSNKLICIDKTLNKKYFF